MEHERKHIIRIPDDLLQQIKESQQNDLKQSAPPYMPVRRKRLKWRYRKRLIIRSAVFIIIPLIIIGFVIWAVTYKNAVEVYASGELIGMVRFDKQMTPDSIAQEARDKLEAENQSQVAVTPVISLKPVHAGNADITAKDDLMDQLCAQIPYQVQASAFMLDGKPLVVLKDEAEAFSVRDNIFAEYTSSGGTVDSVSFVENVSIEDIFTDKSAIITMDKAIEALTAGTVHSSVYEVQPGDVLGQIAVKNNMALSDLIADNPGISAKSTLRIGQKLNIKAVTPLLSVKTVETVVTDETAPAPIQQQINPRAKTKRVLQAGQDGKQRVTENVTKINGVIQDETVLNTEILEEPVPQIVEMPPQ